MSLLTTPRRTALRVQVPAGRARRLHVSTRVDLRVAALVSVVVVLALVIATWTMTLGEFPVPFADVLTTSLGRGDGTYDFVVRTLRLPRTLAAIGVGVALATSGAIFQALVRNPLVAPDIIGVNAGASLAAVFVIVSGGTSALIPVAALFGALGTTAGVYGLTWRKGISGNRLVLVGIGVNAVLAALTTLLIVRYPIEQVSSAVLWLTGTLYARSWEHVAGIAIGLAVLVPAALALMPQLRALQLGDDIARALGSRAEPARTGLLVAGAALAGSAVAVAGPVGFVALMTPHIARMLAGPLTGGVLMLAGALGALLVLASDLIAQHAFSPISLPVGVVTAAVGAPYFLYLLYRSNRRLV